VTAPERRCWTLDRVRSHGLLGPQQRPTSGSYRTWTAKARLRKAGRTVQSRTSSANDHSAWRGAIQRAPLCRSTLESSYSVFDLWCPGAEPQQTFLTLNLC